MSKTIFLSKENCISYIPKFVKWKGSPQPPKPKTRNASFPPALKVQGFQRRRFYEKPGYVSPDRYPGHGDLPIIRRGQALSRCLPSSLRVLKISLSRTI